MRVSIPSRGFWFFEGWRFHGYYPITRGYSVSIPSRGFWFFEVPRGCCGGATDKRLVSIPSRGFWFFEGISVHS